MRVIFAASLLLASLPSVLSWGAAGHEIVATIAQIHLHPNVRAKLCKILPPEAKCHLAPVAAWADQVKYKYPGSGPMHYVNPKLDHPGDHCEYGEHGWVNEDVNVLAGIMNETARIMAGEGDIPLRFLVHFVGDMHQPLHLTGRDRGGNGAFFLWEGRHRKYSQLLHSVWDSGIITKKIRELGNYTSPLPSKQIEQALPGAIFDPYVRWIVWEGIRQWWKDDLESWLACPLSGDPFPHSSIDSSVPPSAPRFLQSLQSVAHVVLGVLPAKFATFLTVNYPVPLPETDGFARQLLAQHPTSQALNTAETSALPSIPACPYTWSKPLHQLNCDLIWPHEYIGGGHPLIELDTPQYYGKLVQEKTMEKLLAMGGLRLASILNTVLGDENEHSLYLDYAKDRKFSLW